VAAAAVLALAALLVLSALTPRTAAADTPSPHLSSGVTTDSCAACHRAHTAQDDKLQESVPESALCFSCHDGTGADSNIAAEYSDVTVPADDPAISSYYAHGLDLTSTHVSGPVDEFGGVLNRHSSCGDCHNPHSVNGDPPQETAGGWTPSGALASIAGVSAGLAWQNPMTLEYELCLKCHSRYTVLLSSSTPTYDKSDKAAEIDATNASYHPIAAPGANTTPQLQNSLNGGTLWQLSTSSTIRCTQCHGNYRLVGDPPTVDVPASTARLAPHTSRYRSLLIANYRNRELRAQNEAYNSSDFSLCYLCHSEAPFTTAANDPRADTNFRYHGMHLNGIGDVGGGGTDINVAGAGQGNAVCAECHFELHSTDLAPWAANRNYAGGVNFGPNVQPRPSQLYPSWESTSRTCALVCHGVDHDNESY
jgi:predicted CXXCH cytochrome family protein